MKIKNFLYKYSIILFIGFVSFLIVSFPFQYTQDKMNNVSQPVRWLGALLFFLICFFIIRCKEQIGKIFDKKSLFVIMLALIVLLQLSTIFVFKIQPVNDLLYLHDEAIRMLRSPHVSLQRFHGYFGKYPNNYGHLMLLYCYYKILSFFWNIYEVFRDSWECFESVHDRSWNCLWLCNITLFEKYQIIKFVDDSIFIESVDILLDFLLLHSHGFLWNHDASVSIVCVCMERTR